MLKKKKFIIAGLILAVAFGFLLYLGFRSSIPYYDSVSELLAKSDTVLDQNIKVKGKVFPSSVDQDTSKRIVEFSLTDSSNNLQVILNGVVDSNFWNAISSDGYIVVQGKLTSDGVLQASELSTKCPSKYETSEKQNGSNLWVLAPIIGGIVLLIVLGYIIYKYSKSRKHSEK